jgi:hypothetical protein
MSQTPGNIKLIAEGGVEVTFPIRYIQFAEILKTFTQDQELTEDSSFPLTNIPENQINKFIEFCNIMEASPLPVIVSGNLANQFSSLDARYTTLLNSLINETGGLLPGGGSSATAPPASTVSDIMLCDMIQFMNFINCPPLLKLFCGFFCLKFLNGKTANQVRSEWGIVNDFTPEEEAQIAAEEAWLNS